jgi:hypothetical protein
MSLRNLLVRQFDDGLFLFTAIPDVIARRLRRARLRANPTNLRRLAAPGIRLATATPTAKTRARSDNRPTIARPFSASSNLIALSHGAAGETRTCAEVRTWLDA